MAMGHRKHKRTILEYLSTTGNTSEPDSDSDKDELIPSTSKRTKHHANPSSFDSNNELLKRNPFLIRNVLACLCENSTSQALFNYRLVGQHNWNELAVNAINQDRSTRVRLLKVIDPIRTDSKCITRTGTGVLINIKELISLLRGGRLEKSTLTRIYLNSSITPNDLNTFLNLNGQNIRTLHYDGHSLKDLRQILQTCAENLKSLSLWRSWDKNESDKEKEGLLKGDDATMKFPRLESLVIVSGELMPNLGGINFIENNICHPSKQILSHIFQASPNLKCLSARFVDSFILDSGLSFKNLTTLCIKFKIRIPQLRTLCDVGLKLKKLRLAGLFIKCGYRPLEDNDYCYTTDPEWMEFRKTLLHFLQTQANTLEYFAVSLFAEKWACLQNSRQHVSPHEQWNSMAGFPRMPNLQTLILHECSGKIPKEEFQYLFPKLKNLEIGECYSNQAGPTEPSIRNYPLHIPISPNSSISVRNIRCVKPQWNWLEYFRLLLNFIFRMKFLINCQSTGQN